MTYIHLLNQHQGYRFKLHVLLNLTKTWHPYTLNISVDFKMGLQSETHLKLNTTLVVNVRCCTI